MVKTFALKNRMLAVIIVVSLICSGVCISSINGNKDVFIPRFTAPAKNNKYYYSDNPFYISGYGMPNCTAYAWGRAYEITGEKPDLSLGNAGEWFEYNKVKNVYDYGIIPKEGAIICFDNNDGGHVAVVEKIEGDKIIFSNSAYNGSNFYLSNKNIDEVYDMKNSWIFQGYIYVNNNNTTSSDEINRVKAFSGLNLRNKPDISSKIITVMNNNDIIKISKIYHKKDYLWGKVVFNGKSGYCVLKYTDYTKGAT